MIGKTERSDAKFDDFPLSPIGSADARELYLAYLRSRDLVSQIPKRDLGTSQEAAIYSLMREVQALSQATTPLFRKRVDAKQAHALLWLSRVRESARISSSFAALPRFDGIGREALISIARLSADVASLPHLVRTLSDYGILLVYEKAIAGMKLDGTAFVLSDGRPVIGMSLRYPRLDIFWFTLMHELAHIVLHYDRLAVPIIDDLDEESGEATEQEADRLARDSLIDRSAWRSSKVKFSMKEDVLVDFSRQINIHPAIVAGRLRRELNRHDIFSAIINKVDVRKILLKE